MEGKGDTKELPQISAKRYKEPLLTRREALQFSALTALAGLSLIADSKGITKQFARNVKRTFHNQESETDNDPQTREEWVAKEFSVRGEIKTQINSLGQVPLSADFSHQMYAGQEALLQQELTLAEIDLALMAFVDREKRNALIHQRANKREEDRFGVLSQLTSDEEDFAENYLTEYADKKSAKEMLAMAKDAYILTLPIIDIIKKELDFDNPQDYSAHDLMISPGGLAALFCRESSGMENIGSELATSQYNEENPDNPHYGSTEILTQSILPEIAKITGVSVSKDHIPGSAWIFERDDTGKITSSGGAIGPAQFMPKTIIRLQELFEVARKKNPNAEIPEFNPLDPMCAMMGVYIKLAEEVDFGNDKRYGWRVDDKNDPKARKYAVEAWNPHAQERDYILAGDAKYRKDCPEFLQTVSPQQATQ